ncbi:MAG: hypothetical protein HY064_00640 [Bacteroidetes bacterium]|nr:hypothetical protein [Bacteroidota bacterium]
MFIIFFIPAVTQAQDSAYVRMHAIRKQTEIKTIYDCTTSKTGLLDSTVTWYNKPGLTDSVICYHADGSEKYSEKYFYSDNYRSYTFIYRDSLTVRTKEVITKYDDRNRITEEKMIINNELFSLTSYSYNAMTVTSRETSHSGQTEVKKMTIDSMHRLLSDYHYGPNGEVISGENYFYKTKYNNPNYRVKVTDQHGKVVRYDHFRYDRHKDPVYYNTTQPDYYCTVEEKFNSEHKIIYEHFVTTRQEGYQEYSYQYDTDSSYVVTLLSNNSDHPDKPEKNWVGSKTVYYYDRNDKELTFERWKNGKRFYHADINQDKRENEYYFSDNGDTLSSDVYFYFKNGLAHTFTSTQYAQAIDDEFHPTHVPQTKAVTRWEYVYWKE